VLVRISELSVLAGNRALLNLGAMDQGLEGEIEEGSGCVFK
jgi:hypothetical protein